jgi:excisionase family DNA binding protein
VGASPSSERTRLSSRSGADSIAEKIAHELAELPPTVTVEQAAKLLGVSRSAAYRAAATGQLPTLAFGRRLVVPTFRLMQMLGITEEASR